MLRLLPMLLSAASADIGKVVRRKRRNLVLYCVAAIFALTAYFSLVMAAVHYLMLTESALASWMMIALVAISLAAIVIAGVMLANYVETRKSRRARPELLTAGATLALAPLLSGASAKKGIPLALAIVGAVLAYNTFGRDQVDEE